MATVTNPFVSDEDAARYARARPYYHPHALHVGLSFFDDPVVRTLGADIGTGTGMSALALREVSERVVAFDVSRAMLNQARSVPGVHYLQARAERLSLRDATCGLVTAGAALHWFEQEQAMNEVTRILRPGGGFIVYTDWYGGELRGETGLQQWMETEYWPDFPSPERHRFLFQALIEKHGLEFAGAEEFECDFRMEAEAFAEYLLSQSNAIEAIAAGKATAEDTKQRILDGTSEWFPSYAIFRVKVWCALRP